MFDFPAICRFCTKKTDLIYNLDDENAALIGKLATIAPDTVEFNASLPQKICQSCHDKLNETYKFQQQIYHIFKIYKTFMEYQQSLVNNNNNPNTTSNDTTTSTNNENNNNNETEEPKAEPFDYVDEEYISNDLRQFINGLGDVTSPTTTPTPQVNETFIKERKPPPEATVKPEVKKTARKSEAVAVKRKRGRPRKYCGLMEFKNDDLTDVEKMKDVVVNSLPNIDPDYEPEPYYEQPLVINLRKKRGRPKILNKQEKENNKGRHDERYIISEQVRHQHQVAGCSSSSSATTSTTTITTNQDANKRAKGKNKKITRIGAIQSDVDPHEYTYQLPYDPKVIITYISNASDRFFFCKTCNKQYCDFSSLRKHFVHHSTIKIFQCGLCEYQTFTKHCLDTHQIVHVDARPETCLKCGKTFKSKDRLHRHSYCHTKRFICDICGKEFSHSAMLKKHIQHIHINERNFFCSVCGFAAKSKEYLNRHMFRHDDNDEHKIECSVCKKLLKTRNSFKIHMKRHRDDRKFECTMCDKKYVVKSQLDIHFRIHTGFKPFACHFCGKQFRKADPFKNHVRIHTNEKPFVCHYCHKKFTQKVSLQVHLRLHTGERPYNCGVCGKSFVQGSVFKLHMKRYHHPVVNASEAVA